MVSLKLVFILTCYCLICTKQTFAQFGGIGYFPYGYNGLDGILGRRGNTYPNSLYPNRINGGYPLYGYNLQYPMYGYYLCYQSIYCGGRYPGNGGYPYYGNSLSTAFASSSSSSGFSTAYASNGGGFFG